MAQELEAEKAKETRTGSAVLLKLVGATIDAMNSASQQLLLAERYANVKMAESSELAKTLEQVKQEAEETKTELRKEVAKGKDITIRVAEANIKIQWLVSGSVFFPFCPHSHFSDV